MNALCHRARTREIARKLELAACRASAASGRDTGALTRERPPLVSVGMERVPEAWLRVLVRLLPEVGSIYRYVVVGGDADWVGYRLAEMLPPSLPDRQALLERDERGPERNGALGIIP